MPKHPPLKMGSLFSGAGLCDLGFHWAGFQHEFFCEVDPYCRSVLQRHWPGIPIYGDIREVSGHALPEVDVLAGGFPCQDVSCGGKRAGITQNTRSGLWYEYKRIIEEKRPKYAVIENVKGLLSQGMDVVLQDLSRIGYDAEWQCVPASAFGAPHLRERIFIVAYPFNNKPDGQPGLLFEEQRNVAKYFQPYSIVDWFGIRIDRARRQTIREAYGGTVFYRVDDGGAGRMDEKKRAKSGVPFITPDTARRWEPVLKALGNGILPQQSYFVARCILRAEGLIE